MTAHEFPDRGIVVNAPDQVRVEFVPEAGGVGGAPRLRTIAKRGRRGEGTEAGLADALTRAGFVRIDSIDFQAPGGARRAALGVPTIDVTVEAKEEAVVLVESDDGAYHWVFPTLPPGGARGGVSTLRRFELRSRAAADKPGTRSIFSGLANDIRAWVLRFAFSKIVKGAASYIDGDGPFGLVSLQSDDVETWVAGPVTALATPAGEAARVLLLLHGTFSSTKGFRQLTETPDGRAFLANARSLYQAVLGFDHKTLGEDAPTNAAALVQALTAIAPAGGLIVDAVAHSRGGLVLRSAIETLPIGGPLRFDRVVFVGCPLAGTHLAEQKNWRSLADLYATLGISAAKFTAPGGQLSAAILTTTGLLAGLCRFVQALAVSAVDEDNVPGLASMKPGGALVSALAAAQRRETGTAYAAITSDFEPSALSVLESPLNTLKALAADQFMDDLFQGDNDLVVDTASMTVFAPYSGEAGGALALGRNPNAYHTVYFAQAKVITAIREWLRLPGLSHVAPPPQAAPEDESSPKRRSVRRSPQRGDVFVGKANGGARPSEIFHGARPKAYADTAEGLTTPDDGDLPKGRQPMDADRPKASPGADVACNFSAQMPPSMVVGGEVELKVKISREELNVAIDAASKAGKAAVDPKTPLDLRIVAISGCEIVAGEKQRYAVPIVGAKVEHVARVRGKNAGQARISVEVTQSGRGVISFLLEPVVVQAPGELLEVKATATVAAIVKDSPLILRIYESSTNDGKFELKFIADCDNPPINQDATKIGELGPRLDAVSEKIFQEIEQAPIGDNPDFTRFEKRLFDLGRKIGRELIPEDISSSIWNNRDAIKAIQVVSGSCRLPWELARIAAPDGAGEPDFALAEAGLMRWLPNCPWPGPKLDLQRFVIVRPTYDGADGLNELKGAVEEVDEIKKVIINPAPTELGADEVILDQTFSGASPFDVFHFAGHGGAGTSFMNGAEIFLDAKNGSRDTITDEMVKQRFRRPEGSFPLIFLNACQAGRTTRSFIGLDGFANAFLMPVSKRGAAAFISSLWSVDDLKAKFFASEFYRTLLAGEPLVEAVKAARRASRDGRELTWLAYTVYGDPFARIAHKRS
jgi:hypothetical protein